MRILDSTDSHHPPIIIKHLQKAYGPLDRCPEYNLALQRSTTKVTMAKILNDRSNCLVTAKQKELSHGIKIDSFYS
ncbi:unnamed protein product [Trichobilharzia regenti]|nr:unnamed protein product [Trichobilharzia regenti]